MFSADLFAVDHPLIAIVILAVLFLIAMFVRRVRGPRGQ